MQVFSPGYTGELELGSRPVGRPRLHVNKRDMFASGLQADNWKLFAEYLELNGRPDGVRHSEQGRES